MGCLEISLDIGLDMAFRVYQSRNNASRVAITDFMTESIISTCDIMRNHAGHPRLITDLDGGWRN